MQANPCKSVEATNTPSTNPILLGLMDVIGTPVTDPTYVKAHNIALISCAWFDTDQTLSPANRQSLALPALLFDKEPRNPCAGGRRGVPC
jgi:hypothetical protein